MTRRLDHFERWRFLPDACQHDNGANCECQLPHYLGFYVLRLEDDSNQVRHVVGRMRQAYDGGMREFIDPLTGDVVGCIGAFLAYPPYVTHLEDFIREANPAKIWA